MDYSHAAVWIDHQDVIIAHFNADAHSMQHIRRPGGSEHLHHKAGAVGSGHLSHHEPLFARAALALAQASEIYLTGPGTARSEFIHYLDQNNPSLRARVVGTEPSDRITERQLLAQARKWFEPVDRMRGTGLR